MKIIYSRTENVDGCDNCSDTMLVYDKDGKMVGGEYVGPLCECPEDAIIGRSLISCDDIVSYMRKAYEAGRNGEEFVVENSDSRCHQQ